jgi:isopentenyl diphosphate isomerase/L-lactate dehydrogenase-like FMN-dependent dehydrogenase
MRSKRAKFYNVAEARLLAKRALPPVLFDYVDGGSDTETTMRENEDAFATIGFRPHAALDIEKPDLSTKVLGCDISMPIVLDPVGSLRLLHPDGDRAAARAAGMAGTAFAASNSSATVLEEMFDATSGPAWFQFYLRGGREGSEELVRRVVKAGYQALIVTIDHVEGRNHERLARHEGFYPPKIDLRTAVHFMPQMARSPFWTLRWLLDGLPIVDRAGMPTGRQPVTWDDLTWIREIWDGPLVVKGVTIPEDAKRARDFGATAVIISNHGGRECDGAPATLRALPAIRHAVGRDLEILLDGGIRRGGDAIKALALGADATLIGRAYAFSLAAAGEAGVTRVLEILRNDMLRTMGYLGCASIRDLGLEHIDVSRFEPVAQVG